MRFSRIKILTSTGLLSGILICLAASQTLLSQQARRDANVGYVPINEYNPGRDANQDLKDAIQEAARTNRNILVEVGGDWCSWCHRLDEFFKANPELTKLRNQNFVTLKVNFSEENRNEKVLSRYPAIVGYPHLFLLDEKGKLLQSQDTSVLESGQSYSVERMTKLLAKWGPNPRGRP